jgi:diguanylate cyclase (GGDEF)-like protein
MLRSVRSGVRVGLLLVATLAVAGWARAAEPTPTVDELEKRVNDGHGHLVGDRVLAALAARVLEQTRKEDTLGRYGGEEFLLLLPNTGLEGALQVAEKVRRSVEQAPFVVGELEFGVTVSAGLAEASAHGAATAEELLGQADAALYEAKRQGRNRSVLFGAAG